MAKIPLRDILTDQQELFCREYVRCLNATKAAIRAKYSPQSATTQASDLLALPKISERVAELQAARLEAIDVSAESILRELARLARFDIRQAFDAQGNLLPPSQWSDDVAAAIAGVEVVERNLHSNDGAVDKIHKIKVWDKPKALDTLAKHLGLLIERVQVSGGVEMRWKGEP